MSKETLLAGQAELIRRIEEVSEKFNLARQAGILTAELKRDHRGLRPTLTSGGLVEYNSSPEKRITVNLSRFARRRLGLSPLLLSDKSLHTIDNAIFGEMVHDSGTSSILTGKEIVEAYKDGVGGDSCMTGGASSLCEFYAINPERVALVHFVFEGTGMRALLWNTNEGITFLDRIYGGGTRREHVFRGWSDKQGYTFRGDPKFASIGFPKLTVDVAVGDLFPYMDTFQWMCRTGDKRGYIATFDDGQVTHKLMSQRGAATRFRYSCCKCHAPVPEKSLHQAGEFYCGACWVEHVRCCANCAKTSNKLVLAGESRLADSVVTPLCPPCARGHAAECDCCHALFRNWRLGEHAQEMMCAACATDSYAGWDRHASWTK
jgi:hypothetical protein